MTKDDEWVRLPIEGSWRPGDPEPMKISVVGSGGAAAVGSLQTWRDGIKVSPEQIEIERLRAEVAVLQASQRLTSENVAEILRLVRALTAKDAP